MQPEEDNLYKFTSSRKTAGTHRNLDNDFEWPPDFGNMSRRNIDVTNIDENALPQTNQETVMNNTDENQVEAELISQTDQANIIPKSKTDNDNHWDKDSVCSRKTRKSASSLTVHRKRHTLEVEKLRQTIEMKKLENKLKLMELENEVRETELLEQEELLSVKSTSLHQKQCDKHTIEWVNSIPADIFGCEQEEKKTEDKNNGSERTEIRQLCETISEAIKSVSSMPKQDRFIARQVVEKDFSYFDGNPEEWPTFISQFKRISTLCDYSPEEKIIKLQKCLRGEARLAVLGMITSSANIDLILKTLEMRFGRPDQIIDGLITRTKNLPFVRDHNMDLLVQFSNNVSCLVATIKSLEYYEHLQNPQLLRDLIQKLPDSLKLQWGEKIIHSSIRANLQDFSVWLNEKASAACLVNFSRNFKAELKSKQTFSQQKKQESTLVSTDKEDNVEYCRYCRSRGHLIIHCSKMKSDEVDTRWNIVTKLKLCFSCLRNNHQTTRCRFKQQCGINGCKRNHHHILHKDSQTETKHNGESSTSTQNTNHKNEENILAIGHGSGNVLLRMVKVKLYGENSMVETVALCDEGSSVTLIDKTLTEKLHLKGKSQPLCIQWTNNMTSRHENSISLNLEISGVHSDAKIFSMKNVRTVENLSLPTQTIRALDWERYPYLGGIPFTEIEEQPMILLGQDNIHLTVARKVVQGDEDFTSPIATKTKLGWIFHGKTIQHESKFYSFHICDDIEISDDKLHELVKQSFTTDAFGILPFRNQLTKQENRAVEIMEKTAKRLEDRFEIGLLWKEDDLQLPESKYTAIQRLRCVERNIQRNPELKTRYCDKISSYVEKGYARKLTPEEAAIEGPRCWYLPHFGVVNANKPNKLRLVFDAASKSHGVSLNDNLLSGPDLLQSLIEVLMKFRLRRFAFSSDVREMFHQVRIVKKDQSSQRFLWRNGDPTQHLDVYEMQVMTFGATCSPTCAQYIKNLNANQLTNRQEILEAIIKKHFVDDYLDCTDTMEEALDIISEVKRVQKLGGFELVNWVSNSKELMKTLSENEDIHKDLNLDCDKTIQRILGLSWNSKMDTFCFKLKKLRRDDDDVNRPTKRQVLKTAMSIFDPLGLIVNFTIKARILIQDIWRTGIGWDDHIDEDLNRTWILWNNDLDKIEKISIDRCYSVRIPEASKIELHVFCDASKKAFATSAYMRTLTMEEVEITLIMARARVAPTKPISIPRLELQAAVMGSRLAKSIIETIEIKFDRLYLWTDSTTVLYWIKGDARKLGQFEAHRIGEIQEITNVDNWHWVPSKLNAADIATRSYDSDEIIDFETWFKGPAFLYDRDEELWPKKCQDKSIDEIEHPEFIDLVVEETLYLPDISRFSKLSRLLRTTAWVLRFVKIMVSRIRKLNTKFPICLKPSEIDHVKLLWIKKCQEDCFSEELQHLRKNKLLKSRNRLKMLSPTIDDRGIIILSGRTDLASEMESSARRPIILPKKHKLVELLLQDYHEKFAHQGVETVLNELRRQYWVIDGRSVVKSIFAKCRKCRIHRAKPIIPVMGQLPVERLTPSVRPFTYTGVDYFGPFLVNIGRRREKRWGVIFTCLTIRAVHLEVAHSLTTDSAIMAVKRMASRRGKPKEIISDNGTNFRGAAEELRRAAEGLDQEKIADTLSESGIYWKFIPPASPHMGGAWERMVRSVKTTFNVILNGQVLKDELLQTIFAECENIINSRPLTKLSIDPNDFDSLTPNHFLLGSTNTTIEYSNNVDYRKEWMKSQKVIESFWKRWTKEYLPTLTKRTRWTDDGKPLKVNDIVIIVEDNAARKFWKLGKVEEVYPGPDGRVRIADVKTTSGIYKRPVVKLCRIDVEE